MRSWIWRAASGETSAASDSRIRSWYISTWSADRLLRRKCADRSRATSGRSSPGRPQASNTRAGMIGRPQTASVSRNARDSGRQRDRDGVRACPRASRRDGSRAPSATYRVSSSTRNGLPPASRGDLEPFVRGGLRVRRKAASQSAERPLPRSTAPAAARSSCRDRRARRARAETAWTSISSLRNETISSSRGGSGGRSSSVSDTALSTSAH